MNCTFYRPTTINTKEFENIIGKLTELGADIRRLDD